MPKPNRLVASIASASFIDATNTFEGVLVTSNPVRQRDGSFEVIDVAAIDAESLVGLPLLDSHRNQSIDDQHGIIVAARHEAGKLLITAHVDNPRTAERVKRGVLRSLSIGYVREAVVKESIDPKSRARTQVVRVKPLEASLVVLPADQSAIIRKGNKMRKKVAGADPAPEDTDVIDAPEPTEAERRTQQRAEIRDIAKRAGLPSTWADAQIDSDATPEQARAVAFEAMQDRSRNAPRVRVLNPGRSPEQTAELRAAGFAARYLGVPLADNIRERAQEFANMDGADHARDILESVGIRTRGMSKERLLTTAFQTRSGQHTQADFPLMLDSGFNTAVRAAYEAALSPIVALLTIKRSAPDFKLNHYHQLGEFPRLQEVPESGEIKAMTRGEARESARLKTYGGIFGASRQLIFGDTFNQLGDFARDGGQSAAGTVADLVVSGFTENAGAGLNFSDGNPLFHASHGNYDPVAADISVGSISDARKAMLLQTGVDRETLINVRPDTILVAPSNLTPAEQIVASITAADPASVNPFSQKLTVVTEPRLEAVSPWDWYLADTRLPPLVLLGLAGAEGVQVSARDGWEVLGREWRVFIDVGVGPYDFRGVHKHEGAAADSNSGGV